MPELLTVAQLDQGVIEAFRGSVRGTIITPQHADYDAARAVHNAMIDRHPGLIVRCTDAADVIAAVVLAHEHRLDLAVRGGGHSGAGMGVCDAGLVIDLSAMRHVRIDPVARIADVGGGAQLGDLDHAAHAFGLAAPAGIISTTGAGGLTLGGGMGHLTRTLGLTIDNLLEADVVLADGSFVTADATRHSDLFWALRGGGGNFGVVTRFRYRLHPVDTVIAGPLLWPVERAGEVLDSYRRTIGDSPDELNGFFAFLTVPPGPPFPPELHMQRVCGIVACWAGDPARADAALLQFRSIPGLVMDGIGPVPLPAFNSAFDALYPPGLQQYWRGDFYDEISDAAIEEHLRHGPQVPTLQSTMHLYPVDGAAGRVPDDDTAWAYRGAKWSGVFVGVDPDPARAADVRQWAVQYNEALRPHSMGGAYSNFMMDEGEDRVRATYRSHYDRLAQIKASYDPDNLFHHNHNIRPAH